jgi:hypothetical protein
MIPSFVKIGNELLNVYTEENTVLSKDTTCYALIFNVRDYHIPVIVEGIIRYVHIYRSLNRLYYVEVQSFISEQSIIDRYVDGEQYTVHHITPDGYVNIINQKRVRMDEFTDFTKLVFPVQAFFVRPSRGQIDELYQFYLKTIEQDLKEMITSVQDLIIN